MAVTAVVNLYLTHEVLQYKILLVRVNCELQEPTPKVTDGVLTVNATEGLLTVNSIETVRGRGGGLGEGEDDGLRLGDGISGKLLLICSEEEFYSFFTKIAIVILSQQ